jgi:aspartate-semialdehyde dehydrogenase
VNGGKMEKIRLAILGATGMAGRDAILHQQFLDESGRQYAELTCVTGSGKSADKTLGQIFDEKEQQIAKYLPFWTPQKCPEAYTNMVVDETDVDLIASKADYAISALGSDVAEKVEKELTKKGVHVFSNASSYRWKDNVPLLIPEANYQHIHLVKEQKTKGKLVCNPNCTAAGYVPLIKAMLDLGYVINHIFLATMQSTSGKGDSIGSEEYREKILGNVRDDWTKDGFNEEEWKSACEPQKILGRVRTKEEAKSEMDRIRQGYATRFIPIHTQTTRVATQYGHLEYLAFDFERQPDAEKLKKQLAEYELPEEVACLPTTPKPLFVVQDRMPEPKTDVFAGNGMAVVVGDIKQHTPSKISMFTLTHNLRRGATWAGRQGLELYLSAIEGRKL